MEIIEQTNTRLVYSQKRKVIERGVSNSRSWVIVAWWCSIMFACASFTMYLISPTFLNIILVVLPILSTLVFWKLNNWLYQRRLDGDQLSLHVVFDLISDEIIISTIFKDKPSTLTESLKQFCDVKIMPYSKFDPSQGYEIYLVYTGRAMRGIYRADTIEEANSISQRIHNFIKDNLSLCPEVSKISKES